MDHRTPPSSDGDLPAPPGDGGGGGRADLDARDVAAGAPESGELAPLQALGRLAEAIRGVVAAVPQLWTLTGDQLVATLEAKHAIAAQLDAFGLATIRDLDTRGHHLNTGATSTAAWLSHHLLTDRPTANADVAAARALDPDGDLPPEPGTGATTSSSSNAVVLAATGRALLAGDISRAHADAVRTSITKLPTTTLAPVERGELHARAETVLLNECHRLTPAQVRAAGTHLRHLLDPDGVLRDERTAEQRSVFWLKPDPDPDGNVATYRYGGVTDPVTAAQLQAFIDAHSAPRPGVDPDTGTPTPDPRTADQRRGHAFADLVRLAANADPGVSGGLSTQLVVTTSLDTLQAQLGERGAMCGHRDRAAAPLDRDHPQAGLRHHRHPHGPGPSQRTPRRRQSHPHHPHRHPPRPEPTRHPLRVPHLHQTPTMGLTPTTSPTGPAAAKPPSTTSSCSAPTTTTPSTTPTGPSPSPTADHDSDHPCAREPGRARARRRAGRMARVSTPTASPQVAGTVDARTGQARLQAWLPGSPTSLWQALTDPSSTTAWLGRLVAVPERGAGCFDLWHEEQVRSEHRILAWQPPRLIRLTWLFPDEPPSEVTVHLADDEGDRTRLVLVHAGAPDPVAYAAGWHRHLEYLDVHLRGEDRAWSQFWVGYDDLVGAYGHGERDGAPTA